jgi:phosphohistidine phosphatase SixA
MMLTISASAIAQPVVFVVRHAERADGGASMSMAGADPQLSDEGRRRADMLASILKDAKLTAIFTTEYKRTQQTAEPVARATGLSATTIPGKDIGGLLEKVKVAKGNVLVIGHANTISDIIRGLGVDTPPSIGEQQYDDIFLVVRARQPVLVRLHYPGGS